MKFFCHKKCLICTNIFSFHQRMFIKNAEYSLLESFQFRCVKTTFFNVIAKSVWLIEPQDTLYRWIKKLSHLLAGSETLFIIDDIIADKSLDKRRQSLLELAISGRHRNHYLWLLTQSYSAIPGKFKVGHGHIFLVLQEKGRSYNDT